MKRYLFVINPASGGRNKEQLEHEINAQFNSANTEADILKTTGKNDGERLDKRIQEIKPDVIVISGGDGTINELTPLLVKYQLPVGIIPTGSANGLATELGIDLQNWLSTIKEGILEKLDVIAVNGQMMVHMADMGLNASLVKRYEEENRRGFLGYAISALKELPSFETNFKVAITSEDVQVKTETRLLVIANTRMYGTGYEVNPKGQFNDQKVELCILKELSPELLSNQLFLTSNEKTSLFDTYSIKNASINTNVPINWQIDGEYKGTTSELAIEVLSDQLEIFHPPTPD